MLTKAIEGGGGLAGLVGRCWGYGITWVDEGDHFLFLCNFFCFSLSFGIYLLFFWVFLGTLQFFIYIFSHANLKSRDTNMWGRWHIKAGGQLTPFFYFFLFYIYIYFKQMFISLE